MIRNIPLVAAILSVSINICVAYIRGSFLSGTKLAPLRWSAARQLSLALQAISAQAVTASSDRKLTTATLEGYTDPRSHRWQYAYDVVEPVEGSAASTPIVVLHTPAGLGVNRQFWNPFFRAITDTKSCGGQLKDSPIYRFDWVGNGDSDPKPDSVDEAYDSSYFAAQIQHFIENCVQRDAAGNRDVNIKPILVVQGSAVPITLQYFTEYGGDSVGGFVIATGISTKFISEAPSPRISGISWGLLKSPFGMGFFKYVSTRNYITNFVKKNFFTPSTSAELVEEWIDNAYDGSRDSRVRFNVYSFISGHFFRDFTADMQRIPVPTLYLVGDSLPDKTVAKRLKSSRPPVPIVAAEKSFQDNRSERMQWYMERIPGCRGKMIKDCGSEIPWEQPVEFAKEIAQFKQQLASSGSSSPPQQSQHI